MGSAGVRSAARTGAVFREDKAAVRAGTDIGEAARMFGQILGDKQPDGGSKVRFELHLGSAARDGKQEMRKKWLAEPPSIVKPP